MLQEFNEERRKTLLGLVGLGLTSISIPIPPVPKLKPSVNLNDGGMNLNIFLPKGFVNPESGKFSCEFLPNFFDLSTGKSASSPYGIEHHFFKFITAFYPESAKNIRCIVQVGFLGDQKPRLIYNESNLMDDAQKSYLFNLSWKNWQITENSWFKDSIKVDPITITPIISKNSSTQKASWINPQNHHDKAWPWSV